MPAFPHMEKTPETLPMPGHGLALQAPLTGAWAAHSHRSRHSRQLLHAGQSLGWLGSVAPLTFPPRVSDLDCGSRRKAEADQGHGCGRVTLRSGKKEEGGGYQCV